MPEIGPSVEQWRPMVREELAAAAIPLPDDLVLATIWTESRGHAGSTNEKSGASGLMQVMPKTLEWYNRQTGKNIPLSALRSSTEPRKQIRVGVWVLGQFWRGAYRYLKSRLQEIPTDELGKIADLFYVAGPGATKKRLDKLEVPFWDYVAARWPEWNALPHTINVWGHLPSDIQWDVESIGRWLKAGEKIVQRAKQGSIVIMAAVIVGYWWFFKKGKRHDKNKEK